MKIKLGQKPFIMRTAYLSCRHLVKLLLFVGCVVSVGSRYSCVCVSERESEREREKVSEKDGKRDRWTSRLIAHNYDY